MVVPVGLGVTVAVVPPDHKPATYLDRNLLFTGCCTLGSPSWSCILTGGVMCACILCGHCALTHSSHLLITWAAFVSNGMELGSDSCALQEHTLVLFSFLGFC